MQEPDKLATAILCAREKRFMLLRCETLPQLMFTSLRPLTCCMCCVNNTSFHSVSSAMSLPWLRSRSSIDDVFTTVGWGGHIYAALSYEAECICSQCLSKLYILTSYTLSCSETKHNTILQLQDRPVIIARTQFIREHRLYEVVSFISIPALTLSTHSMDHSCVNMF